MGVIRKITKLVEEALLWSKLKTKIKRKQLPCSAHFADQLEKPKEKKTQRVREREVDAEQGEEEETKSSSITLLQAPR